LKHHFHQIQFDDVVEDVDAPNLFSQFLHIQFPRGACLVGARLVNGESDGMQSCARQSIAREKFDIGDESLSLELSSGGGHSRALAASRAGGSTMSEVESNRCDRCRPPTSVIAPIATTRNVAEHEPSAPLSHSPAPSLTRFLHAHHTHRHDDAWQVVGRLRSDGG